MTAQRNQAKCGTRTGLPCWLLSMVLHALLFIVLSLCRFSETLGPTSLIIRGGFTDQTSDNLEIPELDTIFSLPTLTIAGDGDEILDQLGKMTLDSLIVDNSAIEMKLQYDVDRTNSALPVTAAPMELQKSHHSTTGNSTRLLFEASEGQTLQQKQQLPAKTGNSTHSLSQALEGRTLQSKQQLLAKYGGNDSSEAAVTRALKWIAGHQVDDGGWSFAHDHVCNGQCYAPGQLGQARNGATAMALLPFLGAGHTHKAGDYKKTVDDGLRYLVDHMNRPNLEGASIPENMRGSWFEPRGTMYSHCLATIVLCEAYAMTHDSYLRSPAQSGLDFLVQSQNKNDGGWRYSPGDRGDTSVVGWAVMALKSGKIGGLDVPESTISLTNRFLDRVSSRQGDSYGYMAPGANPHGLAATTSIGLLCRMYAGLPKTNRGLRRGVNSIAEIGPGVDNLYFSYYATQVMHHYGGAEWKKWNATMRDPLIQAQVKEGHASGSWTPNQHLDGMAGGRLYATAMATMILEVYYRHMPLYSDRALDEDVQF